MSLSSLALVVAPAALGAMLALALHAGTLSAWVVAFIKRATGTRRVHMALSKLFSQAQLAGWGFVAWVLGTTGAGGDLGLITAVLGVVWMIACSVLAEVFDDLAERIRKAEEERDKRN